MAQFKTSKLLLALSVFAAACSSHKEKDPNADLKKNEAWVEKLPVEAGKSVEQLAPTQRIHAVKIKEFQKKGDAWWLAIDGFARVNNEIMPYFWKSPKAPNLEVTFQLKDQAKFEACQKLIQTGIDDKHVLEIYGEGDFAARMVNGKYLGVFKLVAIRDCQVLVKDSYSLNQAEEFLPEEYIDSDFSMNDSETPELELPTSSLF